MAEKKQVFKEVVNREKLKQLTEQQLEVNGQRFDFDEYIDNEQISAFPEYSQRVRTVAKKIANIFDDYLEEVDTNLSKMEDNLTQTVDAYIDQTQEKYTQWEKEKQDNYNQWEREKQQTYTQWEKDKQNTYNQWEQQKQQAYNEWVENKTNTYDQWVANKQTNYDEWVATKQREVNEWEQSKQQGYTQWEQQKQADYNNWTSSKQASYDEWTNAKKSVFDDKIQNIDTRIANFDRLEQKATATPTKAGVVTENRIRAIIRDYGIGTSTVNHNLNIGHYKESGVYTVGGNNGINNKTTTVINNQYDNNWGVQLGLTEEDDPKAYIRSKRNGRWTAWKELGSYKYGYLAKPSNLSIEQGNRKNVIHWTTPDDQNYKGTKIIKKQGSYPANIYDGVTVITTTEKGNLHVTDSNLQNGTEYFYRIFIYDKQENYNNDEEAILKGTPRNYGYTGALTGVRAEAGNGKIKIFWGTPSDPNYAGMKMLRKEGSYPENITDGTVVGTFVNKGDQHFQDNNLENGRTYFYKLFSYNKQEVYNNDDNAKVSVTPTNLGYTGRVTNIKLQEGNRKITLTWTAPSDSNYAGVKIVRKVGSFPRDMNDGHLVINSTEKQNGSVVDRDLETGREYFYKFFTYNNQEVYNADNYGNVKGTTTETVIYTVVIDENNSNPESAVTYADEASGMTSGWENWQNKPIFKDIRPCVYKNGQVQYYLQRDNRTLKENGQTANLSGADGDVVIEFPKKLAYKLERKGSKLHVSVTNNQNADDSWCYGAFQPTKSYKKFNKMYIGAYQANIDLRSISGVETCNIWSYGDLEMMFHKINGRMLSFPAVTLLQCLYLIIYKNLDSQKALGQGHTSGNDYTRNTGETNTKKFCWGSQNSTERVVFLGIESFYGTVRQYLSGIKAKKSIESIVYIDHISKYVRVTDTKYGYTKKVEGTNALGFLARDNSGSVTTYYCDQTYSLKYTHKFLYFGGSANEGSDAGAFWFCGAGGADGVSTGTRVMFLTD